MLGGGFLAGRRAYSFGDVMTMRGGGYAGTLLGVAIADATNPADDQSEPYSAGIIAGSLTGLIVGDRLVNGREFSAGEGLLVQLGWLAGGLTGLGVVALTRTDDSAPYWIGSATGGVLGYGITYRGLAGKATARASKATSWQFQLAPEGLLAALGRGPSGRTAHAAASPPPFARFTCTF
jgi:hypothetical protein